MIAKVADTSSLQRTPSRFDCKIDKLLDRASRRHFSIEKVGTSRSAEVARTSRSRKPPHFSIAKAAGTSRSRKPPTLLDRESRRQLLDRGSRRHFSIAKAAGTSRVERTTAFFDRESRRHFSFQRSTAVLDCESRRQFSTAKCAPPVVRKQLRSVRSSAQVWCVRFPSTNRMRMEDITQPHAGPPTDQYDASSDPCKDLSTASNRHVIM